MRCHALKAAGGHLFFTSGSELFRMVEQIRITYKVQSADCLLGGSRLTHQRNKVHTQQPHRGPFCNHPLLEMFPLQQHVNTRSSMEPEDGRTFDSSAGSSFSSSSENWAKSMVPELQAEVEHTQV